MLWIEKECVCYDAAVIKAMFVLPQSVVFVVLLCDFLGKTQFVFVLSLEHINELGRKQEDLGVWHQVFMQRRFWNTSRTATQRTVESTTVPVHVYTAHLVIE